jgi:hypothetical protein
VSEAPPANHAPPSGPKEPRNQHAPDVEHAPTATASAASEAETLEASKKLANLALNGASSHSNTAPNADTIRAVASPNKPKV